MDLLIIVMKNHTKFKGHKMDIFSTPCITLFGTDIDYSIKLNALVDTGISINSRRVRCNLLDYENLMMEYYSFGRVVTVKDMQRICKNGGENTGQKIETFLSDENLTTEFHDHALMSVVDDPNVYVSIKKFHEKADHKGKTRRQPNAGKKAHRVNQFNANLDFIAINKYGLKNRFELKCATCNMDLFDHSFDNTTELYYQGQSHHPLVEDFSSTHKHKEPTKMLRLAGLQKSAKYILDNFRAVEICANCHTKFHSSNRSEMSLNDQIYKKSANSLPLIWTNENFFNNVINKIDIMLFTKNLMTLSDAFAEFENAELNFINFVNSMKNEEV